MCSQNLIRIIPSSARVRSSVDLVVGAQPLRPGGQPLDALDQHAPVPGARSKTAIPPQPGSDGQAPEEVVPLLVVGRRRELDDPHVAGVELGDQPADRAPLPEASSPRRSRTPAAWVADLRSALPASAELREPPPAAPGLLFLLRESRLLRSRSSRTPMSEAGRRPAVSRDGKLEETDRGQDHDDAESDHPAVPGAVPVPADRESDGEQWRKGAERVGQMAAIRRSSRRCWSPVARRPGPRRSRPGGLSGRRGRRAGLLSRPAAWQAGSRRGPGRRREDRARQGDLAGK